MSVARDIYKELKEHAPFTVFGSILGIAVMAIFKNIPVGVSNKIFYIFHPMHIVVSALATTSMYEMHKCRTDKKKCNIFSLLLIGYAGSVGIATLSDSIIPYIGEVLLNMPYREAHIGFIEKWWLINPLAVIGVAIAYFRSTTKFSHFLHVLLSTWASLFHIIMAAGQSINLFSYLIIFLFLFLAVWLPCCLSDIVFPLFFVRNKVQLKKLS